MQRVPMEQGVGSTLGQARDERLIGAHNLAQHQVEAGLRCRH